VDLNVAAELAKCPKTIRETAHTNSTAMM